MPLLQVVLHVTVFAGMLFVKLGRHVIQQEEQLSQGNAEVLPGCTHLKGFHVILCSSVVPCATTAGAATDGCVCGTAVCQAGQTCKPTGVGLCIEGK